MKPLNESLPEIDLALARWFDTVRDLNRKITQHENENPKLKLELVNDSFKFTASVGAIRCVGSTPSEAMLKVYARLCELAQHRIESLRAEAERLEKAKTS